MALGAQCWWYRGRILPSNIYIHTCIINYNHVSRVGIHTYIYIYTHTCVWYVCVQLSIFRVLPWFYHVAKQLEHRVPTNRLTRFDTHKYIRYIIYMQWQRSHMGDKIKLTYSWVQANKPIQSHGWWVLALAKETWRCWLRITRHYTKAPDTIAYLARWILSSQSLSSKHIQIWTKWVWEL